MLTCGLKLLKTRFQKSLFSNKNDQKQTSGSLRFKLRWNGSDIIQHWWRHLCWMMLNYVELGGQKNSAWWFTRAQIQHHSTRWPNTFNMLNSTMQNSVEWNLFIRRLTMTASLPVQWMVQESIRWLCNDSWGKRSYDASRLTIQPTWSQS